MMKIIPYKKVSLLVLAFVVMSFGASATTFTAVTSGDWTSNLTWGGNAPGTMLSGDDVIIPANITVNMNTNVELDGALASVSVEGDLESNTNDMVITNGTLTGGGTISIDEMTMYSGTVNLFTGQLIVNDLEMNVVSYSLVADVMVNQNLILTAGTFVLDSGGTLDLATGSTIYVNAGSLGLNGGTFNTNGAYNVAYTGNTISTGTELSGSGMHNVTIDLSDDQQSVQLTQDLNIDGTLMLSEGDLDLNGMDLHLSGDIASSGNGRIIGHASSNVSITGNAALSGMLKFKAGSEAIHNFQLDISSGNEASLGSNMQVMGQFDLQSGTLMLNNNTLTISGDISASGSGYIGSNTNSNLVINSSNAIAGMIRFSGSANNVNNFELNINSGSSVNLGSDVHVTGSLDLMSGNLAINDHNLTISGDLNATADGHFEGSTDANLFITSSNGLSSAISFEANHEMLDTFHVALQNSGAVELGSGLMIDGHMELNANSKVMLNDNNLYIGANATFEGASSTSYVAINGTGKLGTYIEANDESKTFPIGFDNNYTPANITVNTTGGVAADYWLSVASGVWTNGTSGDNMAASNAVVDATWFVESDANTDNNLDLEVEWKGTMEVNSFNRAQAYLSHYTNGAWDVTAAANATTTANGTFKLKRQNITSLSPFAVMQASPSSTGPEYTISNEFQILTSPNREHIWVKLPSEVPAEGYLNLMTLKGQVIAQRNVAPNSSHAQIRFDMEDLSPGLYLVSWRTLGKAPVTKQVLTY